MKSPWHFVSRLTSRNSKPSPESAAPNVPEAPLLERSETPSAPIEVMPIASAMEVVPDADPVDTAGDTLRVIVRMTEEESVERQPDADEAVATSSAAAADLRNRDAARVELRSQNPKAPSPRIRLSGQRKANTKQAEANSGPDPKETFVLDAVDLDDDIKELRIALAEKLETQNRQLRSMLSRFNR